MKRRNFLMFLPWLSVVPKIAPKIFSIPMVGKEVSTLGLEYSAGIPPIGYPVAWITDIVIPEGY